jgi:hypothetical protein
MSPAGWYTADLPPRLQMSPVFAARALFALPKQALS